MSYILDALSKSQKERDRESVPTLTSAFLVAEPKRHVSKVLVGASIGVLSIGVLVTAFGLSSRVPDANGSSDRASAAVLMSPEPVTIEARTTTVSGRRERGAEATNVGMAAASPIPIPAKEPQRRQAVSATQDKARSSLSGISRESESTMVAATPELAPTVHDDRRLSPVTKWLLKEMTALDEKAQRENIKNGKSPAREVSRPSVPSASTVAGNTQPSPNPERAAEKVDRRVLAKVDRPADPTDEVAALRDLPPETRSAIPALEVNVHTYSQNRADRMVLINMKRYREGDRLAEGPVVHAITPTGVVLVHEKQRFHLPIR